MINYGKQSIDRKDISEVLKVLKSDWLTQGPQVNKFELALKKYFGAKYCSVVSNGTAALHLTGLALGWKKGDVVLTSPISFLASSNCILYSGATPDFVDIESTSYNIDLSKLEKKIKPVKLENYPLGKTSSVAKPIDFTQEWEDAKDRASRSGEYDDEEE